MYNTSIVRPVILVKCNFVDKKWMQIYHVVTARTNCCSLSALEAVLVRCIQYCSVY